MLVQWGLFHTVRASPLQNCKQLLYFKIKQCLMITVPTHKRHKSPFKHSKTIYVFTSGRVIVTVQINSRKKILKGLKWPLQNGRQYRSAAGFTLSWCKFWWKGLFAGVGWRCSKRAFLSTHHTTWTILCRHHIKGHATFQHRCRAISEAVPCATPFSFESCQLLSRGSGFNTLQEIFQCIGSTPCQ